MSLFSDVMGATVGKVYSAATGNVDPWTKQSLVDDETDGLVQASGGAMSQSQAATAANQDVTGSLTSSNADPSQPAKFGWFSDLASSLNIQNPADFLKSLLEIAGGLVLLAIVVWLGKEALKKHL
jgi:hypothetical protein